MLEHQTLLVGKFELLISHLVGKRNYCVLEVEFGVLLLANNNPLEAILVPLLAISEFSHRLLQSISVLASYYRSYVPVKILVYVCVVPFPMLEVTLQVSSGSTR